jgi:predicted nucleotidyltransferase
MGFSQREERLYKYCGREIYFSPEKTADSIKKKLPFIDFAFLFGSAKNGVISPGADLDIAICFERNTHINFDNITKVISVIEEQHSGIECDLGILNTAGPIFCFEVLKGRLLFVRENKLVEYTDFYSRTCREYEETMSSYKRYYRNLATL